LPKQFARTYNACSKERNEKNKIKIKRKGERYLGEA